MIICEQKDQAKLSRSAEMPQHRLVEGQHFGICCQRLSADAPKQSKPAQRLDTAASKKAQGEARHVKATVCIRRTAGKQCSARDDAIVGGQNSSALQL